MAPAYLYLIQTEDQFGDRLPNVEMRAKSPNGDWAAVTNGCGQKDVYLGAGSYAVDFYQNGQLIGHRDWTLADPSDSENAPIRVGLASAAPAWPGNRRDWRGVFIVPDLFPNGAWPTKIFGGDGKRLWTPAYGCYTDAGLRREMRSEFRFVRGYRFWPYDCAGWIYHQEYGFLEDDPVRVRRDLIELMTDDIIPVVSACNDADGGSVVPFQSFTKNADLIPIAFPMWEMNGPLGVATYNGDGTFSGRIVDCIRNTRAAMKPAADLYLHFTAGHGSIGEPEREGWRYCRDAFQVLGLLSQDEGYERDPVMGDPAGTGAGLQDTAERLATLGLLNVRFEQCTYAVYNKDVVPKWAGWNEDQQVKYGNQLRTLAPLSAGFCDGGTA